MIRPADFDLDLIYSPTTLSLLLEGYSHVLGSAWRAERDSRLQRSHALADKLYVHAVSAHQLLQGVDPGSLERLPSHAGFIDLSSIQVVVRAAADTYAALAHVFITPEDDDEATLRYCAWMLAGFRQRAEHTFTDPDPAWLAQQQADKRLVRDLEREMRATRHFQALSERQQMRVLRGRGWQGQGGVTKVLERAWGARAQFRYRYLSSWAHSDGLTVAQNSQLNEKREMAETAMIEVMTLLGRTILDYVETFGEARRALRRHQCQAAVARVLASAGRSGGA